MNIREIYLEMDSPDFSITSVLVIIVFGLYANS